MIPLGAMSPRVISITEVLADNFTGASLDTGEWTAGTKGASSTVTQNDVLICTLTADAVSNARVTSTTVIPITRVVDVYFDWTPGKLYYSAYGRPYVSVKTAAASRDANYEYPLSMPTLRLGINGNTTARTSLRVGVLGGTGTFGEGYGEATGTWNENSTYSVQWRIDWATSKQSLWIDDVQVIAPTAFGVLYTPSGDHFLELGSCDYGAASNAVEKFDNLVVTHTI